MSIKVTFEFETAEDAADFILGRGSNFVEAANAGPVQAAQPSGKPRGRPRKEAEAKPADPTVTAAAPAASPAPAAVPATAAATPAAETAAAVPFAALVEPLTALADKDLDAAVAILGKFGVKTARELKPEQFGAVLTEVNAALNKPAARASLI